MCERLDAASIAVPSGDRLDLPAFSVARPDEGLIYSCVNWSEFLPLYWA